MSILKKYLYQLYVEERGLTKHLTIGLTAATLMKDVSTGQIPGIGGDIAA